MTHQQGSAVTDEQILAVRTALANAEWDMNLSAFASALGIEADYYAEELFVALRTAVGGMSRFDSESFVTLVRAGLKS